MSRIKNLDVSLTLELHGFIADHVASGRFASASEVVRAALRALGREDTVQPISHGTKPSTVKP